MNVLVIRRSAFGDILHILPVLASLKSALPDITLTLLVKSAYEKTFSEVPFIDKVITEIPDSADIVIDCQGLMKTAWLTFKTRAWLKAGYGFGEVRELPSILAYDRRIRTGKTHIIDRHAALFSSVFGCQLEISKEYRSDFLSVENSETDRILSDHPAPRLVIHPVTSRDDKNLQPEEWFPILSLFREKGWSILLSCGPGEERRLDPWQKALPEALRLPVLPFGQFAAVLSSCDLIVGGDTGPVHLADQLGIPVLGWFTLWEPERNGPYFSPNLIFYRRTPDVTEVKEWYSKHFS